MVSYDRYSYNEVWKTFAAANREGRKMAAVVVGAAFVGSLAAAFVVQRAVLGAMFRALDRGRAPRP
jgi:hypothetical protein